MVLIVHERGRTCFPTIVGNPGRGRQLVLYMYVAVQIKCLLCKKSKKDELIEVIPVIDYPRESLSLTLCTNDLFVI